MYACVCLLLIFTINISADDSCSVCRYIAKQFVIEHEQTSGKSFVGGNSLWEKKNIGTYATSETRFHDIVDKICSNASGKNCHIILDSLEDSLESWWSSNSNRESLKVDTMENYLCVINNFCCPFGSFGPSCLPCLPCFTNGGSCVGNGTRSGSGKCICYEGYEGDSCGKCKNDTHFLSIEPGSDSSSCVKCHSSCLGGCKGPSTSDCVSCQQGWTMNSTVGACVDVNECVSSTCKSHEFCVNTLGSFKCEHCHRSCLRCHGTTTNDCDQCAKGYVMNASGKCEDLNECAEYDNICKNDFETCRNTEGSYICDCMEGHVRRDGFCIPERIVQDSTTKHKRKVNSQKIIWTVSFLKEFSKYVGALFAFCVFYYLSRKNPILVCSGGLLLGSYLYFQSITLDNVFLRQH